MTKVLCIMQKLPYIMEKGLRMVAKPLRVIPGLPRILIKTPHVMLKAPDMMTNLPSARATNIMTSDPYEMPKSRRITEERLRMMAKAPRVRIKTPHIMFRATNIMTNQPYSRAKIPIIIISDHIRQPWLSIYSQLSQCRHYKADTSQRRTRLAGPGHDIFPCILTLIKADTSLKRTTDTFWKNFGPKYPRSRPLEMHICVHHAHHVRHIWQEFVTF